MKIVVLAGGLSNERDVSLSSGSLISNALIELGHQVFMVDLFIGADDISEIDSLFIDNKCEKRYYYKVPDSEPDLNELMRKYNSAEFIGKNVLDICKAADIVFIALHGGIGENGKLQALFDIMGIKYTGTGSLGSALAMDKVIAKRLMQSENIKTPDFKVYTKESEIVFEYPCVIKPVSNGSSIGVSMAGNREELEKSVKLAFAYEEQILVEKLIAGREFSVGILDGKALPVIEIIPKSGFYDYKNKYQNGLTNEVCPAEVDYELCEKLQQNALKVHKLLKLGYYSRIDFIADYNNEVYCLEANTLPGMTPTSLLPQEAHSAGISYNKLCGMICCGV